MPACLRLCLFIKVSKETTLDIKPRFPHINLEARPMVILGGFGTGCGPAGAASTAAAALQPDRTTAPARLGAMNMSVSLATGAIIAAPTKNPAATSRPGSRIFANLVSALRLASYCQRLLGSALLPLLLHVSLLASVLLGLSQSASVHTLRAIKTIVYRSTRLSKQATRALWDSKRIRRLRKKIEFEFFTLILGAGGNNLFLVVFWPGWCILGLAAFALSAWCAG